MSLGPGDLKRLRRILLLTRALEDGWSKGDRLETRDLSADPTYAELKGEIEGLTSAEAESLRRLAPSSRHFHNHISLAHFYAGVVPFERLANRGVRDDEFLVHEGDLVTKPARTLPLKVIAENLRSAFNVGALFRTAECVGASEIVLCGYTPGPDDEKTARTAMGSASVVNWRRCDRAPLAIAELKREGYTVIALETARTATSLHEFKFSGPVAFVVGNERFGVDAESLKAADAICRIPVRGMKNSMNVGVAFGIAAFEWLRQYERITE